MKEIVTQLKTIHKSQKLIAEQMQYIYKKLNEHKVN